MWLLWALWGAVALPPCGTYRLNTRLGLRPRGTRFPASGLGGDAPGALLGLARRAPPVRRDGCGCGAPGRGDGVRGCGEERERAPHRAT